MSAVGVRRPVLAACVAALACGAVSLEAQTTTDPSLVVTTLPTTGLSSPTTMAFLGPDDFLVLEKSTGRVRRMLGGVLQPGFALDVAVNSSSERGLLGLAILAGAPTRVFLYYTESATDGGTPLGNRIYRYDWDPGTGTLVNPQLILDLPVTPGPNHDGGILVFDSSNRLHAVIGDLNRNGQLQNFPAGPAPDDTGVVLRMNPDGTPAAGNPFTPYCSLTTATTCTTNANCPGGETCLTQVARYYAYGVRNSFGLTFDPMTGALWDTENGPSNYDEVNLVASGFNSGWEALMGPESRTPGHGPFFNMPGGGSLYSDPEFAWLSTIAPTAIFFPVGTSWGPAYDNVALVGDNNFGAIYSLALNGGRTGFNLTGGLADLVADNATERDQLRLGQGFGAITDIKRGPDNHVYVVSIFPPAIYRIAGPVPVELQRFTVE